MNPSKKIDLKRAPLKGRTHWLSVALLACGLTLSAAWSQEAAGPTERASEEDYVTTVGPLDLISNDGTNRVRWSHPDGELEFGERFKMTVDVERTDGEPMLASLAIDSRMPEHSHGMKREPRIVELAPGRFEVSGMLFHMPGYWEIYFDLTRGAVTERAQVPVDLY
jgi:hypothetical protein